MSQPPYDPRRQPQRPQRPQPQQPYQGGEQYGDRYGDQYGDQQYGDQYGNQYPDQQYGYDQPPPQQYRQQAPHQPRQPQARQPQPQQHRPAPPQREMARSASGGGGGGGGGIRIPGAGMLLTLLGTVVQILSLTVLPWVASTKSGGNNASLYDLYHALTTGSGAHSFGDWYVVLFSYPLVVLGVLLAFAAVLESVAAKVIWGVLALLGLAFLVARYGFGPLAGVFGSKSAMHFSTVEIVVAVVALIGVVIVAFTLKMAVSMFRRVAGVILIALSGVHVFAVMDLVKASSVTELSVGAFGPTVGYLLIGIAALIGPRRLLPGL